jgi:hypothetical protein
MNELILEVYSRQAAMLMPPPAASTMAAAGKVASDARAAPSQSAEDDVTRAAKRAKPSGSEKPSQRSELPTTLETLQLKQQAESSDPIGTLLDDIFLPITALKETETDATSWQLVVPPRDGRKDDKVELLQQTASHLQEVSMGRLLRARSVLSELWAARCQVDRILTQVERFWADIEIVLAKATHMREHMEAFVGINSQTSPNMHQRFLLRIDQYHEFWNIIRAICGK